MRLLLAIVAPIAFLCLLEGIARTLDLAPPQPLVVLEEAHDGEGRVRLRALGISTDTPHVSPSFPRSKAPGVVRIAWFGESAAAGFPQHETSTPARWLTEMLNGRLPDHSFEVVDCAIAGIAGDWLEAAASLVLPLDVDIALVYAGNNEFLSAFVDRRRSSSDPSPRDFLVRESRFVNWLSTRLLGPHALKATRSPLDTRGHLEESLGDLRQEIEEAFEHNLVAIGETAREHGVRAMYFRPVGARREWPPLSSVPREGLSPQDRKRLRERLDTAAVALAATDRVAARAAIDEAAAIDPDLALVRFRVGALAEAEGDLVTAAAAYEEALDRDDRPTRVNKRLAARIEAAAKRVGAPYRDADAHFRGLERTGLTPARLLIDHVHLSIEGHYRLAEYLASCLVESGWPVPPAQWRPSPVSEYSVGLARMGIKTGEGVSGRIQLGFAAILAAYEQPANRVEHLGRARKIFDEILTAQRDQPRALCGRGVLAAAEKRSDDAIADIEAAFRISPDVVREVSAAMDRFAVFREILEGAGLRVGADGRFVRD